MPRHLIHFAFVGVLVLGSACVDVTTTTTSRPTTPATPSDTSVTVAADAGVLLSPSKANLVIDDTLTINGAVYRGTSGATDTLDWTLSDTAVASIDVVAPNRILLHAHRTGYLTVSANTRGALPVLAASTSLKIFALSTQPAPVDASDFHVFEYWNQQYAQWRYAPQLSLRATGPDSVQLLNVTLTVPQIATYMCRSDGLVGKAPKAVFAPLGDGNMLVFYAGIDRAPQAALAQATITIGMSDGTAARIVVTRTIESAVIQESYDEAPMNWLC